MQKMMKQMGKGKLPALPPELTGARPKLGRSSNRPRQLPGRLDER